MKGVRPGVGASTETAPFRAGDLGRRFGYAIQFWGSNERNLGRQIRPLGRREAVGDRQMLISVVSMGTNQAVNLGAGRRTVRGFAVQFPPD